MLGRHLSLPLTGEGLDLGAEKPGNFMGFGAWGSQIREGAWMRGCSLLLAGEERCFSQLQTYSIASPLPCHPSCPETGFPLCRVSFQKESPVEGKSLPSDCRNEGEAFQSKSLHSKARPSVLFSQLRNIGEELQRRFSFGALFVLGLEVSKCLFLHWLW